VRNSREYECSQMRCGVSDSPLSLILPQGTDVRSVLPDGHVISSRYAGWGSSGWIDLPRPLQSVCQRHAPNRALRRVDTLRGRHGHHSNVPLADASCQLPWVILNNIQRWLNEWRIDINVSKTTAIIFARAGRRFFQLRLVKLFGEPIELVDTTRYLRVTLDTRLAWSPQIDQVRRRTVQMMGMLCPSWIGRVIYPSGTESCYISSSSGPWWTMRPRMEVRCPYLCSEGTNVKIQVSSPRYWRPLVRK